MISVPGGKALCLAPGALPAGPLTRGLTTRLLATPGSGGVLRDLVGRAHGSFVNGALRASAMGREGGWGSVLFDSSNDRLELATSVLQASSQFTIAWWERIVANTNAYPSRFRLSVAGGTAEFLVIRSTDANYAPLAWAEVGSSPSLHSSSITHNVADTLEIWHHWMIVCRTDVSSNTAADWDCYTNGLSQGVTIGSGYGLSGNTFNYVGYDGADHGADCHMDDVCVWKGRALSAAEAMAFYEDSRRGCPQTLPWVSGRAYFFPAGGGANNYSETVALGATLGGSASPQHAAAEDAALGVTFGGDNEPDAMSYAEEVAAAVVFGGGTSEVAQFPEVVAMGVTFGGDNEPGGSSYSETVALGAAFGGSTAVALSQAETAALGLSLGGSADAALSFAPPAAGGVAFGAGVSDTHTAGADAALGLSFGGSVTVSGGDPRVICSTASRRTTLAADAARRTTLSGGAARDTCED